MRATPTDHGAVGAKKQGAHKNDGGGGKKKNLGIWHHKASTGGSRATIGGAFGPVGCIKREHGKRAVFTVGNESVGRGAQWGLI